MNAVNSVSAIGVVGWPDPWPPAEPTFLQYVGSGDFAFEWIGHPDGHIQCNLSLSSGESVACFHSQPVRVPPRVRVFIATIWDGAQIKLVIDETELEPLSEGCATSSFEGTVYSDDSPVSLDHPHARTACRQCIEWREPLGVRGRIRPGRREKTVKEEIQDLHSAISSLGFLTYEIQSNGKHFLLGHLVTELRALVYWDVERPNNRQYNPLLFRMAAKANIPLPVYACRDRPFLSSVSPQYHLTGNMATLVREDPSEELMDLQDWLLTVALVERNLVTDERRVKNHLNLISECANTLGCAHYDPDASEFIDILNFFGGRARMLFNYFVLVARVVTLLGQSVLQQLGARADELIRPDGQRLSQQEVEQVRSYLSAMANASSTSS